MTSPNTGLGHLCGAGPQQGLLPSLVPAPSCLWGAGVEAVGTDPRRAPLTLRPPPWASPQEDDDEV